MPVIPRSRAEMARMFDYMHKLSKVMDAERMPAREVVDVYSNMLLMALCRRRQEADADAIETIDIIIDKLKAMRAQPDAEAMIEHLLRNAVRPAPDC